MLSKVEPLVEKYRDFILYGFSVSRTDSNGVTVRVDPRSVYAINVAHYGKDIADSIDNRIINC